MGEWTDGGSNSEKRISPVLVDIQQPFFNRLKIRP